MKVFGFQNRAIIDIVEADFFTNQPIEIGFVFKSENILNVYECCSSDLAYTNKSSLCRSFNEIIH